MKIRNSKSRMTVKLQDILLSQGCNPKQFKYVKTNPDDIIFQHIPSGKNVSIRY